MVVSKEKNIVRQQHLILYDGECGLCDRLVSFLIKIDHKKLFLFAPSQGTTAKPILLKHKINPLNPETFVLIEKYQSKEEQAHLFGKGALRSLWILGGAWSILGLISFLPPTLYDWLYRLIARHRKNFFPNNSCSIHQTQLEKERFLP